MFREADSLDIARCAEVDGGDVLFHLRIVAGFIQSVICKDLDNLCQSYQQDDDAEGTGYPLAAALFLESVGLLFQGIVRYVLFFRFHVIVS